jgi:uncharacterized protein
MQINVSQLLKSLIGSTREYEVDEAIEIGGRERRAQGRLKLTRTDRGILAQGLLYTETEIVCSRCLEVSDCRLTLKIEEEYYPTTDILTGAPIAAPEQTDAYTIDEHHIVDLTEAVRQYAALAVPMKPLCRANCAGLCPTCGRNLNEGDCGCPQQPADPRWAALNKLAAGGQA